MWKLKWDYVFDTKQTNRVENITTLNFYMWFDHNGKILLILKSFSITTSKITYTESTASKKLTYEQLAVPESIITEG